MKKVNFCDVDIKVGDHVKIDFLRYPYFRGQEFVVESKFSNYGLTCGNSKTKVKVSLNQEYFIPITEKCKNCDDIIIKSIIRDVDCNHASISC